MPGTNGDNRNGGNDHDDDAYDDGAHEDDNHDTPHPDDDTHGGGDENKGHTLTANDNDTHTRHHSYADEDAHGAAGSSNANDDAIDDYGVSHGGAGGESDSPAYDGVAETLNEYGGNGDGANFGDAYDDTNRRVPNHRAADDDNKYGNISFCCCCCCSVFCAITARHVLKPWKNTQNTQQQSCT